MGISLPQLILILLIVLVLFGAGRLPKMMADLAKGLRAFKKGLEEDGSSEHTSSGSKDISEHPAPSVGELPQPLAKITSSSETKKASTPSPQKKSKSAPFTPKKQPAKPPVQKRSKVASPTASKTSKPKK